MSIPEKREAWFNLKASLVKRLILFRRTALPTFLDTTRPSRLVFDSDDFQKKTRTGVTTFVPFLNTLSYSADFRSRFSLPKRLSCKTLSSSSPASFDDRSAAGSSHAYQKSVLFGTFAVVWLKCSLHFLISSSCLCTIDKPT